MTTPTATPSGGPSAGRPNPQDFATLSVADVTDWLQTFSGPDGQKQLADQGSIGLVGIVQEATSLEVALKIIVDLIPDNSDFGVGVSHDSTRPTSNGQQASTAGSSPRYFERLREVESSLNPGRNQKVDPDAVLERIRTLHDQEDIEALSPAQRTEAARRVANLLEQLARVDHKPECDALLGQTLHVLLRSGTADQHRGSGRPSFQRVILESDRRTSGSDDADLDRVIQRVVSEAFAQATFLGNSRPSTTTPTSYTAAGAVGPVSMYAQNLASIPPDQRTAAAAGLAAQVSTEQAVLQRQIGPAVSAALNTVDQLQALSQIIDFAEFAALKAAIAADLNLLVAESGRADGPRSALVTLYLARLQSRTGRLIELAGVEAKQDGRFDSTLEESRRALLELLQQQIVTIKQMWDAFFELIKDGSFSRVVIDAQRLLDATSSATREWIRELDGTGLTQDERRLAIIGERPDTLIQALADPDVADQLNTIHGHVKSLSLLPLPKQAA